MHWVSFFDHNKKFYFGGFASAEAAEAACFVTDYNGASRDCRQEKRRNGPYFIIQADDPPNKIAAPNLWEAVKRAKRY